jgi:hypothetical protein
MRFGAEIEADYGRISAARRWWKPGDMPGVQRYSADWFDVRMLDAVCDNAMRDHGVIPENGLIDYDQTLCPGNWVVTTAHGLIAVPQREHETSYEGPPRSVPGVAHASCNDCTLSATGQTYAIALKRLGNLHMNLVPDWDKHNGDLYIVEKEMP